MSISRLNKMTFQSFFLEFLFPFYLTILKVKITEFRKTKDRKTLDLMLVGHLNHSISKYEWIRGSEANIHE